MGWFDKKPPGKDETARGPETAPREASTAPPPAEPPDSAPMPSPPVAEPEPSRGLAAMFSGRTEAPPASPASVASGPDTASVFGESVEIEGSLDGEGDVTLRGHVRGSISITGVLVVSETGRVLADVAAREVICGGTVEGNIVASERVRVQGTGLVQGDIDSPSIVIEDGGGVEGFVQMAPGGDEPEDEEPAARPAPPPAAGRLGRAASTAATQATAAFSATETTPAFGAAETTPAFGAAETTPAFGAAQTTPAFGAAEPAPLAAAPLPSARAASIQAPGPQKLTREMLLGLGAPQAVPAAGLLNRPAAMPATAPTTAPQAAPASPNAPLDIFEADEAPLAPEPLPDDLLGGNGTDGPLLPGSDLAPEPPKRPLPEL